MWIIKYRNWFYAFSATLLVVCAISIMVFGLRLGIEFTGGTLIDVRYPTERPDKVVVEDVLNQLDLGAYSLRPAGTDRYLLRTRDLTESDKTQVLRAMSLAETASTTDVRATTIGPVIGEELRAKAVIAIALIVLMVVCYVAFTFQTNFLWLVWLTNNCRSRPRHYYSRWRICGAWSLFWV